MRSLRQAGHFTLNDIARNIGMPREEKTLCRVMQEIRKVHADDISEKANRYGRKFQYTYKISSFEAL